MASSFLPAKAELVKVMLNRVGMSADIDRPDGSASENKYGKIEDGDITWQSVGTETLYRQHLGSNDQPREESVVGGRVDRENPVVIAGRDTDVQEDDRLTFSDGRRYRVDQKMPRQTHNEFRCTLIDG